MSQTITLPGYSFSSVLKKSLQRKQPDFEVRSKTFTGPSPFDVPDTVELKLDGPQRITFVFDYVGDEPEDVADKIASKDGSVTVRLGRLSKKIKRLSFSGDVLGFIEQPRIIDESEIDIENAGVSRQTRNSFRQNVRVVQSILSSLPPEVALEVRRALEK